MTKKKIKIMLGVILTSIITLLLVINLSSNNQEESKNFKVAGITKSPLYLPLFVGIEKGYFKNLDVEYVNTTGADIANTMLLSKEIDVALNSLNIVLTNAEEKENRPVAIGVMTTRGGITLVSKKDFKEIETIVSAKKGGLPNMILENSTDYKIVANLSPQEGVTYFLNQDVDAIMAFEPFATNLKNQGYKTKSMNELYNDIPFNCLLVLEENTNKKEYKTFLKGLLKATDYIYNTDSKEVAKLVKDIMDFKDEEVLSQIIDTFKKDEVYSKDYKLSEQEYNYYLDFTKSKKVNYKLVYKKIL